MKKKPFHAPLEKLAARRRALAEPREPSEEELWALATAGASPLPAGADRVAPASPGSAARRSSAADLDAFDAFDDEQAMLVGEPCEGAPGEALLEGAVKGLDREVVRRLRRGGYRIEGRLDLHGLARDAAQGAVERFLRESRLGGKRCLLLVHGRGRHSADQQPVLKEALHGWLTTGRFGRQVLAFATALPVDGGAGALYVLLRRAGR